MAKVDAEYREYLDETAGEALDRARERLPAGVSATYVRHSARSAAVGLLELAEEHQAKVIVLGSSSHGSFGHVALGSVTDRLVHSSPVTLAFAPRGFRCRPDLTVSRATAAYGGSAGADELVLAAANVAAGQRRGAPDRVVRGLGAAGVHHPAGHRLRGRRVRRVDDDDGARRARGRGGGRGARASRLPSRP